MCRKKGKWFGSCLDEDGQTKMAPLQLPLIPPLLFRWVPKQKMQKEFIFFAFIYLASLFSGVLFGAFFLTLEIPSLVTFFFHLILRREEAANEKLWRCRGLSLKCFSEVWIEENRDGLIFFGNKKNSLKSLYCKNHLCKYTKFSKMLWIFSKKTFLLKKVFFFAGPFFF